ncbi:hypothetical protein [Phytopseudomonas dryadis]|uniref:Uncharacterized protein n=1 Tax=Phytopseudomonas dryadis TaxID=2487520 RepID=A0ABY1Z9Q1_9GAMM|nr:MULTISPECIES: hypothetical protein [Pseudomonas]TBV08317.1 hypothetical protein DNK34_06185 [Pseudomonas dryadis]TBV19680.1 hypothetical protein DNK41_01385 [Pseudomonas sp. FRB 230]
MNRFQASACVLAAVICQAAHADDDGLTLQQQRDRIGEEMVRERTGQPPAGSDVNNGMNQPAPNTRNAPGNVGNPQAPGVVDPNNGQGRSTVTPGTPTTGQERSTVTPGTPTTGQEGSTGAPGAPSGNRGVPSAPAGSGGTGSSVGGSIGGGSSN